MKLSELAKLETIEQYLEEMNYEDIPEEFIKLLNKEFDKYSYLKSLMDMKHQEFMIKKSNQKGQAT